MKESLIADDLFRRAFIVALLIGVLCRGLVLRVTDKQYPSRPQDYLEQIIISGLSASLGAIAFPALIDKEFSALTFFAVAIQQFQGLSQEERITIENIDNGEVVPKGAAYIEEISSTYESRSYISLFSSLVASVIYIYFARAYKFGFLPCTILAAIGGVIVGFIFKRYLRRSSIGDIADVVEAKINFDGPILKVNDVFIENIGLEDTRSKYLKDCGYKNMADIYVTCAMAGLVILILFGYKEEDFAFLSVSKKMTRKPQYENTDEENKL